MIFGGGPLLVLAIRRPGILFLSLWLAAAAARIAVRGQTPPPRYPREGLRAVSLRFLVFAPVIACLARWLWPGHFLTLPREKPGLWLAVMLLYPLLSVWPQEMVYRAFLFTRYRPLLGTPTARICASAVAFAFAHVIFLNWIAVILTFAGGLMFARDYERYGSLAPVCLEHSLYGCLIFTVGMGQFFYTGAAWHHAPA